MINDKYHDRIARFFNVTTEWLKTGVGERVGDSPSINTSRGIEPHEPGNTGLTLASQIGESVSR